MIKTLPSALLVAFLTCFLSGMATPTASGHEMNLQKDAEGYVTEIQISLEDQVPLTIRPRYAKRLGADTCLELPYEPMSIFSPLKPWEPIPVDGVPALAVLESVKTFPVSGSPAWVMRVFILQADGPKELPPIEGTGEVYYFWDFDGDGSLEFVNEEGHQTLNTGIPHSQHVYMFDGVRYRHTADG
ncbi:hypothetical protein [Ruficoccus sp. ZRK36]|uniref:hypothetical protein n=1 Tax=Ruficoccus sp. ZRK36 TaxID=2866311 RepID=UPI001C72CAF3|nr:hypothetical protein [Ruficoccus sp. ZRK36]QYY36709.1 hypothetical protein K0V07_04355 [Ruficoccus sp. ZRK36]